MIEEVPEPQPSCEVVKLAKCEPGTLDSPTGEWVALLQFFNGCRKKPPMALTLADAKTLSMRLLRILAFTNDERSQRLLSFYELIGGNVESDGTIKPPPQKSLVKKDPTWGVISYYGPLHPPNRCSRYDLENQSKEPPFPPIASIRVEYVDKGIEHKVYGAFRSKTYVYLLCQCFITYCTKGEPIYMYYTRRIDVSQRLFKATSRSDEYLQPEDWETFNNLKPGSQIRIGSRHFSKVSIAELKKILRSKKPWKGIC